MQVAIYNVVKDSIENSVISITSALKHNPDLLGYIFLDFKIFESVELFQEANPNIKFLDINEFESIEYESNKLIKYIDFEDNHPMFLNFAQYFIDNNFDYIIYTHEKNYHIDKFENLYHDTLISAAQLNHAREIKKASNKFKYSEQITERLFYNDKFIIFNLKKLVEVNLFDALLLFIENYYYSVEDYDENKKIEAYYFIDVLNQYLGKIHSHTLLPQKYFVEVTNQYPYFDPEVVINQSLEFNYFDKQFIGYEEIRHNFYNVFAQLEYIEMILEYIITNINFFPTAELEVINEAQADLEEMIIDRNTKYQEMINNMS